MEKDLISVKKRCDEEVTQLRYDLETCRKQLQTALDQGERQTKDAEVHFDLKIIQMQEDYDIKLMKERREMGERWF